MSQTLTITPTSLSNHGNIRYIGKIGSGEMILDRPNRLNDTSVGTCIPECAYRMLQFIRKGWIEHLYIVVEATNRQSLYSLVGDKTKIKKMKKQFKKTNNFQRSKNGGTLGRMELDWCRHCLIYNAKTKQYIDTSNGRVMILNQDNYEERKSQVLTYELKTSLQPELAEKDDEFILDAVIHIIRKNFKEIYRRVENDYY